MEFDIEDYIYTNFSRVRKNSTNQFVTDCIFCNKNQHLYIDSVTGNYICFSCNIKGRHLIGIVSNIENLTFREARAFIFKKLTSERRKETVDSLLKKISERNFKKANNIINIDLPKEFVPIYKNNVWKYPKYLKFRGINRNTAKNWKLGFCRVGKYAGRLIIPINCPNGRSFTARDVTNEQNPKYLNPSGANHGSLLLGWEHIKLNEDLILVEGPLDAIKLYQYGLSAVAIMGKVLHLNQLKLLLNRVNDAAITIMLDSDAFKESFSIARQLSCKFNEVYIAKLPCGIDPCDAAKKQAIFSYENATKYSGRNFNFRDRINILSNKINKIY